MAFYSVKDVNSVGAASQPYIAPRSYSDEQLAIINSRADVVVGQAFAGTGKSTTGIGYAVHNPDKKILVICFNRANAVESRAKYGAVNPAVDVLTTHALARRRLGPKQNARIAERWNTITLRKDLSLVGARSDIRTASIVHSLLNEFFISTDKEIDPVLHGRDASDRLGASKASIADCARVAQRLWLAMNSEAPIEGMNMSANTVAIPHDAYLKMFVMNTGNLGYDTVIFDEAQDANPIMLELLRKQYSTGSKVIMLGDRHQAIYEFRGAINALDAQFLPPGAEVLPLTRSWRFGPQTASIANAILGELKGEQYRIQGMGLDAGFQGDQPLTSLSRTNADLVARAISWGGKGINWVGGIGNYRVGVLNDVWALRCNRRHDIKDAFLKNHFPSWADFEQAAVVDNETKILLKLTEKYGDAIPFLVRDLEVNAQVALETGEYDLTLTTGHKAKGLEWDYVSVSDDFCGVIQTAEDWLADKIEIFPEQEVNLLYVMATRARHQTLCNHEMQKWLRELPEHRQRRKRTYKGVAVEERCDERLLDVAFRHIRPPFRAG